jgi:hypothetical protein
MSIRQKRLLFFISLIIFTIVILSCTQEKNMVSEDTIYGSWVRSITDAQGLQFNAELKIKNDNSFDFILLENVAGHTNSSAEFTLSEDIFTVINDKDCGVDGVYEFVVTEKKLTFIAVADECVPRKLALQGVWSKK